MNMSAKREVRVLLMVLAAAIFFSIIITLILEDLDILQSDIRTMVMIPILLFNIFTTVFSISFTGIMSYYTQVGLISVALAGMAYYVSPYIERYLELYLAFFTPGVLFYILLAIIPLLMAIYIWIKLYAIVRG